jgi:hypothetical protein
MAEAHVEAWVVICSFFHEKKVGFRDWLDDQKEEL